MTERFAVILLLLAAGCSYRQRDRVITAADVAEGRTKLTNYLHAPLRPGQPSEQPWGQITRAAVEDEASVTKADDKTVCIHIVERTHEGLDMSLASWNFRLDGAQVNIENEKVAVSDWQWNGQHDVLVAEAVTKEAFAQIKLEATVEKVYRVYERSGDLCGPRAASDVVLEVELPQDDHKGSWGERFVWKLR